MKKNINNMTPQVRAKALRQLVESLVLSVKDLTVFDQAFTHSSYTNEHKNVHLTHNQRLEFLGDAVLDLIIGEYLFYHHKDMSEGDLTKIKAIIVCETSLAACSEQLHLNDYLLLGIGEDKSGGRRRPSIQADTFEAFVGAIYVSCGYEVAQTFVLKYLHTFIEQATAGKIGKDYKTLLQERIQRHAEKDIRYVLIAEEGPDHDKRFIMEVLVNGKTFGTGRGKSKKEAEQHAAKLTLEMLPHN